MANVYDEIDPPNSGNVYDQFHVGDVLDVAKSAGIGVAKGGVGILGLPGDIGSLVATGAEKIGIPENIRQGFGRAAMLNPLLRPFTGPGSQDIQKQIEGMTGEFYKPKTMAGEYAQTVGEFLPAAAAGPGGIGRRLLAQTVVPAVGGETAAQTAIAVGAPEIAPYARMAGAIGSGIGASKFVGGLDRAPALKSIPTTEEIRDAATANYQAARQSGVEIRSAQIASLAMKIESDLSQLGLTARNVPETYGVIRAMQGAPKGSVMRSVDLEAARQELVQARQNISNRREAVAANKAIDQLDNYLAAIPARDVLRGDVSVFRSNISDARKNWAAAARAEMVTAKQNLGELNAQTAGSGMNEDNALRQSIKQLIRPDKSNRSQAQKAGFSPQEIALANKAARGTVGGNIARYVGKLAPTGIVSGTLGTGWGAAAGSPFGPLGMLIGGVTAPTIGLAARALGNASTARNLENLSAAVRARSPLAASNPSQMTQTLVNAPPWLQQIMLGSLMARPGLPAPYGFDQPQ